MNNESTIIVGSNPKRICWTAIVVGALVGVGLVVSY